MAGAGNANAVGNAHPSPGAGPSPWVRRFASRLRAGGTVLDLACGGGRHSLYFAARGHPVTAVDIDTARIRAVAADHPIEIIEADLERGDWPLPERRFDAVVVVNYLHRAHFPLLCGALEHGGLLLYDTFAVGNERHGKPSNPDFLLQPGELLREFGSALEVVAYENGEVCEPQKAVRQRLCAIRR